jgi:hypothetical protein
MRYRRFGKTNFHLSIFSLGTMRCLQSQVVMTQTLAAAVNLGINHLETAAGYGQSEVYLGRALQELGVSRSQLYITSKIPPTPDAASMERAIDQSLQRLGLDYLDALALHGLNTWEHLAWAEASTGCWQAVQRAIADGRLRHGGFSTHAPLEVILRAIATERFDFVNLHYTYFFQRNAAAIAQAHQQDMGIFIISPGDKGGLLYTPPQRLEQLCQPFSPLALTYRFLLSDPRITTLSVGAANPTELHQPLQLADQDYPLTESEQAVLARLQAHEIAALGGDRCSQCYACLPCPEAINIPEVLRLRNLSLAYDMTRYGQYRYGMFEQAGHWFPGTRASRCTDCGDCLPRCPESLPIPTLLNDAHDRLQGIPKRRLWG